MDFLNPRDQKNQDHSWSKSTSESHKQNWSHKKGVLETQREDHTEQAAPVRGLRSDGEVGSGKGKNEAEGGRG